MTCDRTYTRSNRKWKAGCFHGTGKELVCKAYDDSKSKGQCYEAIVTAMEKIDKIHWGAKNDK